MQYGKVLLSTLMLTLSCGSFAQFALAEETQFSATGHVRLRAEGNDFTDFSGYRDYFLIRARPVFKAKRGDQFTVIFAPQFSRTLGESAYLTPVNTGVAAKTGQSGSTVDPYLGVHEAYLQFSPVNWLTLKGGRMMYSYGDELVIGSLEWNNVGRSFDGFNARAQHGLGWTDLIANKITDNNTLSSGAGDVDLFGLYNSFDFGEYFKAVDLYYFYQKDASTVNHTHLGVAGVRLASPVGDFDYRTEFTKEMGNAPTDASKAYQFDVEAGYRLDASMKPRFSGEFFTAGSAYNQMYPTVHKWLGFADVLGRKNVTGFAAHLEAQVVDSTKVKIDYHHFSRTDSSAPAYKLNGSTALGSAAASSSKNIGDEVDLTVLHKISADLTLTAGASILFSSAYLTDQFTRKNPTFYYTALEAKF